MTTTLSELDEMLDARPNWHLAFFPEGTPYAVLDFDFKKFGALVASLPADELARLGSKIDANRLMMEEWRSELEEYTYVAVSKSKNGNHGIIEYPCNRRRIETSEGHPLDLLGAGFIVLTGWSCGPGYRSLALASYLFNSAIALCASAFIFASTSAVAVSTRAFSSTRSSGQISEDVVESSSIASRLRRPGINLDACVA